MFNLYAYEKNQQKQKKLGLELTQSSQSQDKIKSQREKLFKNYTKRISEFILHMDKKPIKINTYLSPIENTGRLSDPEKFKGKPYITVREYKTHRERLLVFFI